MEATINGQSSVLHENLSWNRERSLDELRSFVEDRHQAIDDMFDDEVFDW